METFTVRTTDIINGRAVRREYNFSSKRAADEWFTLMGKRYGFAGLARNYIY